MAGDKHKDGEVNARIEMCYQLRYSSETSYTQKQWIDYCHKNYGDRSEQQYCAYWAKAKDTYDEIWQAKLDRMLDPAMNALYELLASEDEKVRQRAIDQIVKYTGNDIDRVEAKLEVTQITTKWTSINNN